MYNEQQDYYSMKHESSNFEFDIKQAAYFTMQNSDTKAIKDPKALGVYTYMKMLMSEGVDVLPDIICSIALQFDMTDKVVLSKIKVLDKLGLIMICKNTNN